MGDVTSKPPAAENGKAPSNGTMGAGRRRSGARTPAARRPTPVRREVVPRLARHVVVSSRGDD